MRKHVDRKNNRPTHIWVTWSFIGFHQYPAAPPDVLYLKNKHRHTFNIKAAIPTNSAVDRELEFHMVRTALKTLFEKKVNDQNTGSCEAMAHILADIVEDLYHRKAIVTVDEDGECGATVGSY